ncbi:YidB family protein [Streptomyces orinoci]|uniref:YidB family protein n=1 Tax=Streptomyces orinoci TaxID=67339 RepID=A0ABV3K695_STRON|nr:YidB family protein [Streptomyces orinoci]
MAGSDLGSLLEPLLGGSGGQSGGSLLGSLLGALGSGGGQSLEGLIQELNEGGLGEKTRSWVSTGANQPATGPEIAQAVPDQVLNHVAQHSGLSPEQAADRLAEALPQFVDKLTPGGEIPQGSLEDVIRQHLG